MKLDRLLDGYIRDILGAVNHAACGGPGRVNRDARGSFRPASGRGEPRSLPSLTAEATSSTLAQDAGCAAGHLPAKSFLLRSSAAPVISCARSRTDPSVVRAAQTSLDGYEDPG